MNDFIKRTWNSFANKYGLSHWASWGDIYAIQLEIDNISNFINNGDYVLDVGCANGFSAIEQLSRHKIKIVGIDFSEKMIRNANLNLSKIDKNKNISFRVGDIKKLPFDNCSFDITYTTRVIINIPCWEDQKKSILECIRVTKKGGKIILSEAFWEPLVKLNSLRTLVGLEPLVEHDFNRYIKKSKLNDFLEEQSINYKIIDFSSVYYLGSRFLREIVTDYKKYKGYNNPINKEFFKLEKKYSGGDFGIQQLYVIYK